MLRTALAQAALSVAGFSLAGCIHVDWNRGGGYYRSPPPGYHGDGYHRGGRNRDW